MSNNVFKQDLLNIISGLSFLFIINILTDVKEDFTPNQFGIFIRENDIVRNLVYIIVIFITIQLSSFSVTENPFVDRVSATFIIYLFILLFSKQTLYFSIAEFVLFLTLYFLYFYMVEIDTDVDPLDSKYDDIYLTIYIIIGILFLVTFIGFYFYYNKQLEDKKTRFSIFKFIFGKKESSYKNIE